jgi:hypothetical protein
MSWRFEESVSRPTSSASLSAIQIDQISMTRRDRVGLSGLSEPLTIVVNTHSDLDRNLIKLAAEILKEFPHV